MLQNGEWDNWQLEVVLIMIKNQQKTLGRNGRAVNSLNGDHFNLSCLSATAVTLREVLCEGTKKCLRGSNMKKQSFWTVRSLNKNMSSFGVKDIMKVQRFRIWWKLLISFFVTYCSVGFQRLNSIRDNHMFHWFFFSLIIIRTNLHHHWSPCMWRVVELHPGGEGLRLWFQAWSQRL